MPPASNLLLPSQSGRPMTKADLITMLLLQQAMQEQEQPTSQPRAGLDPLKGALQHEGGKGLLSSMFGGGSGGAASASYNIPASYLPSTTSVAPQGIGTAANGGTLLADGSISGGGMSGTGAVALPAAVAFGTYLSGKDLLNGYKGKEDKSIGGKVGRAQNALITGGASEIFRAVAGHKSTKQRQKERNDKLIKSSPSFASFHENTLANEGRAKAASDAAAADFVGFDPNGVFVNNKFKNSRNVKDLTENDITGSQAFFEKDPDWMKKTLEERNATARRALDSGAVREGKGMIDVDWKKFDQFQPPPLLPQPQTTAINNIDPGRNIFGTGNTMSPPDMTGMAPYASKPPGLQSGMKMKNGKTYISPGVYR